MIIARPSTTSGGVARTGRIEDRRRNCAAIAHLIWTHGWKVQPPGAVIGFLGVGQRRSGGSRAGLSLRQACGWPARDQKFR
jgi:hypothetical protein